MTVEAGAEVEVVKDTGIDTVIDKLIDTLTDTVIDTVTDRVIGTVTDINIGGAQGQGQGAWTEISATVVGATAGIGNTRGW